MSSDSGRAMAHRHRITTVMTATFVLLISSVLSLQLVVCFPDYITNLKKPNLFVDKLAFRWLRCASLAGHGSHVSLLVTGTKPLSIFTQISQRRLAGFISGIFSLFSESDRWTTDGLLFIIVPSMVAASLKTCGESSLPPTLNCRKFLLRKISSPTQAAASSNLFSCPKVWPTPNFGPHRLFQSWACPISIAMRACIDPLSPGLQSHLTSWASSPAIPHVSRVFNFFSLLQFIKIFFVYSSENNLATLLPSCYSGGYLKKALATLSSIPRERLCSILNGSKLHWTKNRLGSSLPKTKRE